MYMQRLVFLINIYDLSISPKTRRRKKTNSLYEINLSNRYISKTRIKKTHSLYEINLSNRYILDLMWVHLIMKY